MKKSTILIFSLLISIFSIAFGYTPITHANWSCIWSWGNNTCSNPDQIPVCSGNECTIEAGSNIVKKAGGDIFSGKSITKFITDTVLYFLSFVTLVGVVYILYAGFQIMTGAGDEEKIKKSRQIIIYVLIGIIVMWLAYAIVGIIIGAIK